MIQLPDFSLWFHALWGHSPFPWQRILAEQLVKGEWPKALDLPTAAGKTACIDVAVYALAAQAETPVWERTAPRRIWFVVDRRIVVDEAFARAEQIAQKLATATDGPLRAVAERLLRVSGTTRPLATARLRGGVLRDDGWARLPSQPAVITSTVDQLGSRLLFRGYGNSPNTASIFAGLAGHDSLILLDEAHLSVPFMQTLRAVERYRGPEWAEEPIRTPFAFALLSATPPSDGASTEVFPGTRRAEALDHPALRQRIQAQKPAELVEVTGRKSDPSDPLVAEAVARARMFTTKGRRRVAVVVNRVATAQAIAHGLREAIGRDVDVVLLTGRLRPLERDTLVERWRPLLRANTPEEPARPIVLVATQCIEVGADFSFDALVSEAASLDALRQRFGRLNRLGMEETALAAILIRTADAKDDSEDPVYGTAMPACWRLLSELAEADGVGKRGGKRIDFGIAALDSLLQPLNDFSPYLALVTVAPLLLPAHLDLLCQTAPPPPIEPAISLYLHGIDRGQPEVRVVWRADLSTASAEDWAEIVALCPPNSMESLSVPLPRLRGWLSNHGVGQETADVEGGSWEAPPMAPQAFRPVLVWRGRERSRVVMQASELRPDDLVVLPTEYGIEGLGQSVPTTALGGHQLDIWEPSHRQSGKPATLRLHREVLQPWRECPPLAELIALAEDPDWESEALQVAIDAVLDYIPDTDQDPPPPPQWLTDMLRQARSGRVEKHPANGLILFAPSHRNQNGEEQDLFADDDDLLSATGREVSLDVHSASVERAVGQLAQRCLPEPFFEPLRAAAYWHDVGKLDERFQMWLRQGNELEVLVGEPLAKSRGIATSPERRRRLREASGLPERFRHEMLSMQLAERYGLAPHGEGTDGLLLHAIASHHGYARPFAPSSPDPDPPPVHGRHAGAEIDIDTTTRAGWPVPESIAAGTAERFWRLTRRHGWWGLAYLEAILRLGDWYGSQRIVEEAPAEGSAPAQGPVRAKRPTLPGTEVPLTGVDGANPLGFLCALGTMVVLHEAGHGDARLLWRREGLTWRPRLTGLPTGDRSALAQTIADGLRGSIVSAETEAARKDAQMRLGEVEKKIKEAQKDIKLRRLRGKERQQAYAAEISPLEAERKLLQQDFLRALRQAVPRPELALGKNIDATAAEYRALTEPYVSNARYNNRECLDLLAAFASDGCLHRSPTKRKEGKLAPTPFSFISGSGHQDFLETVRGLLQRVTPERVSSILFSPWRYDEEGLSMRWDPVEDRRYALMDRDPTASDNKPRTVWMANLLAYRALALFPSAPGRRRLLTTGWTRDATGESFVWPLWIHPADRDTIRSLLLLPELYSPAPDRQALRTRGVEAVFRARRIKVGSGANFKINFSAAREV